MPLENCLALIEEAQVLFHGTASPTRAIPQAPARKVSATWGNSIQVIAYEVRPLGGDRYRLLLQYKCLKAVDAVCARITHLIPSDPAGLDIGLERQSGLRNWDGLLEPPTSSWAPGNTYVVSADGRLPKAGAPWTIRLGLVELLEGKLGGPLRDVLITDTGTTQQVPGTSWVALPAAVDE